MDTRNNDLQTELSNTAELLAASIEARLMMADTIADLRTENATLRTALKDALAEIARLRYGMASPNGQGIPAVSDSATWPQSRRSIG